MGLSTLQNVRFAGMASCVPRRILSNIEDCPPLLRSERERLIRNIGIEQRRICADWQCFSDLAFIAAERLLADLKWGRNEVDALIVMTQSPDYIIPSTAIILQDRLGLNNATIAYDVNLGCSAYPFGIHLIGNMLSTGSIQKALLLVGDKCANIRDPLFSDAGTATALEFYPGASPMYFDLNSDGAGYKAIMLPVGGHREPYNYYHGIPRRDEYGQLFWPNDLILDGPAVLSFSTQKVPAAVERTTQYAGLKMDDINHFVFHQANRMINDTIRKKLKLTEERVPSTLKDLGNTSGASIPVTITARLRDTLLVQKQKLLICGFGIGLSWGTSILDIDGATFPEMLEA
jgi:3-oxoacyl-[acyl-carrier-protein] synthase-3